MKVIVTILSAVFLFSLSACGSSSDGSSGGSSGSSTSQNQSQTNKTTKNTNSSDSSKSNDATSNNSTSNNTASNNSSSTSTKSPSTNANSSNSSQTNQEAFYGTWTIGKVIAYGSGGGTYSTADIKALEGKQLIFSNGSATCFGDNTQNLSNTVSNPVYKKTVIAKDDFPSDYRVTFDQLGITGDTVTEVDATGSKGICTVFFITPDKNKLILFGGGTFFELDK